LPNIDENKRIVGGIEAEVGSWPATVLLIFRYKGRIKMPDGIIYNVERSASCGGTIIDESTILTAAHCFPKKLYIDYLGDTYEFNPSTNEYYPTYESMFTVYVGMHKKNEMDTNPSTKKSVKKIIIVYFQLYLNNILN
jgi:hypothetical protein